MTATNEQPRVLGRYRLLERIGAGGTADIWRALDETTSAQVAVKLLHEHLLPDAAARARLAAEARAYAGLDHPGIARLLGVDAGDRPAVVLELVRGESLAARLERDGPMSPTDVARLGAELAEALYHAHTRGVIHRDVKPGNVLLASDGHARLVDFGIARLLGDAVQATTQAGTVMGTLRYMAPEQLRGEVIGPRTDLFGLGAVLHEAATGRPPYPQATPMALLQAEEAGPGPLDGLDPALAAVIRACLQPTPDRRPLHAGRVAEALRAVLEGNPAPALALDPAAPAAIDRDAPTRAIPIASLATPPGAPRPEPRRAVAFRGRPRSRLALAGAIAALVVLATLGFATLGSRPAPAVAVSSPLPTPNSTPLPAWAAQLADEYRAACGDGPTAAELAAIGLDAATQEVDSSIAQCAAPTKAPGHDRGRGHGKD